MITHEADAFRANRSSYRIAEPLVTFYHAVMRPNWGALDRPGRATAVWQRAQPTFLSKVVGAHFEELCRQWARWHASPDTHGGHPAQVASGTVNDPARRTPPTTSTSRSWATPATAGAPCYPSARPNGTPP